MEHNFVCLLRKLRKIVKKKKQFPQVFYYFLGGILVIFTLVPFW